MGGSFRFVTSGFSSLCVLGCWLAGWWWWWCCRSNQGTASRREAHAMVCRRPSLISFLQRKWKESPDEGEDQEGRDGGYGKAESCSGLSRIICVVGSASDESGGGVLNGDGS